MKKLLNILLIAVLAIVTIIPNVSAAKGTYGDKGSITVNNAAEGEEYNAYRILVLESYDSDRNAYSYKASSKWENFVNNNAKNYLNVDSQGYVTWVDGADEVAFAKLAYEYAKANKIEADYVETAVNKKATFKDVELGYYLVDSSVGAICDLTTTNPNVEINEKNQIPDIGKDTTGDIKDNGKIGDKVEYTITAERLAGLENVRITDTLSKGLTLVNTVTNGKNTGIIVKNDTLNTVLVEGKDYEVTITSVANGTQMVIKIFDEYTKNMNKDDKIIVKYDAIINTDAVVGEPNTNEVDLDYGNGSHVDGNETKTYTYGFKFYKTDGTVELTGAIFKLLNNDKTKVIGLVKVSDTPDEKGYIHYRVATKDDDASIVVTEIEAGKIAIDGLAAGTYYLREIKAPEGYNKLAGDVEIVIKKVEDGKDYTILDKEVINTTGAQLPSTGGMGTMLFITIGSLMVLGFGIMLITKYRMAKESE